MKTDFLKNLGIEDQSVINQIMAENGKDIAHEKGKASSLQEKIDALTNDLAERDSTIADLKKLEGSDATIATLNERIKTLENEATAAKTKYDSDIKGVKKGYLTDEYLREHGAKSIKMAKALLDMDKIDLDDEGKITGLEEQLTALADTDDYKLAFSGKSGVRGISPSGSGNADPNSINTPKTLAEIIKSQLETK